jgi:hypothetical protein
LGRGEIIEIPLYAHPVLTCITFLFQLGEKESRGSKSQKRLTVQSFKGQGYCFVCCTSMPALSSHIRPFTRPVSVHLREYYEKDGKMNPGKGGACLYRSVESRINFGTYDRNQHHSGAIRNGVVHGRSSERCHQGCEIKQVRSLWVLSVRYPRVQNPISGTTSHYRLA